MSDFGNLPHLFILSHIAFSFTNNKLKVNKNMDNGISHVKSHKNMEIGQINKKHYELTAPVNCLKVLNGGWST